MPQDGLLLWSGKISWGVGNRIFIKSLGDSKGTKTSNVIHLLSSKSCFVDVYITGITYSADSSFQGQVLDKGVTSPFLFI